MRTQSSDTNPMVEQMQIAGLRRLSPWQRFELANRLTRGAFALSWQNFRRRYADLDEEALALHWVRLLYGADLASRVAAYLARRRSA